MKNLALKERKNYVKGEAPYEVWSDGDWSWLVLKKWQADDDKPYARWFCRVFGYSDDMGDTYVADIKSQARLVWRDPIYALALENQGVRTSVDTSPDGWKRYTR